MSRDQWYVTLDLRDAYFHVPVHPAHLQYLRFAFEGTAYEFRVLPISINLAPCTFTKCIDGGVPPPSPCGSNAGSAYMRYADPQGGRHHPICHKGKPTRPRRRDPTPWDGLCRDPLRGIGTRRGITYPVPLQKPGKTHLGKSGRQQNSNQIMDLICMFLFCIFTAFITF